MAPDNREDPRENSDPNELEDPVMFCNTIATSRPQSDEGGDALLAFHSEKFLWSSLQGLLRCCSLEKSR